MQLSAPGWLVLLAPVFALVVAYVVVQRRRRKRTLRFANMSLLEQLSSARPNRLRHAPFALLLIGLILLTIALAGPTAEMRVPRNRATVVLVIDVSLSMEATDVKPSRLAAAQKAAKDFVDGLTPGINLGLVTFSGTASVLVSPTVDRGVVKAAIDQLKLNERTATGEGIYTALQSIETIHSVLGGAAELPPAQIVLESDGKQTIPDANDVNHPRHEFVAARQAKDKGVPINTISFGTGYGRVEITSPDGGRDIVEVPVDDEALQEVARLSGGTFHTASTQGELEGVYGTLGEQIGFEVRRGDISRPWTASSAIALIAGIAVALGIRQRIPA